MTKSEDAMSGTTVSQTETIPESEKGQTRTSLFQWCFRYIGNTSNSTRDSAESNNKDYKGEIDALGAVLALKYEKLELNKSFDVFREKNISYTVNELNIAKDTSVGTRHGGSKGLLQHQKRTKIFKQNWGQVWSQERYTVHNSKAVYWEVFKPGFKHHMGTV